jgi:hypothetical protein
VKYLFSIVISVFICIGSTFAADFSIKLYDRTVYYPGNSPSEPILVNILIANNGTDTLRFKLADDHFFSLDFTLTDTRNQGLGHTETWLQIHSTNRKTFYREISIEPGEAYSFIENVKDYIKIDTPGMYILGCVFYPELENQGNADTTAFKSNKLSLEIKPSPGAAAAKILPFATKTQDILKAEAIPPDQVVNYMLTARQKQNWEQFFLYIDLEQMLSRDPARKRSYRNVSENDRFTMIENYKSELTQSRVDQDIVTIPVDFKIEKTSYTETEGTVSVLEWFKYPKFREKKRFTYYLSSRDGIWYVYNYTVDNLGTE